jgi:hypothetical protein
VPPSTPKLVNFTYHNPSLPHFSFSLNFISFFKAFFLFFLIRLTVADYNFMAKNHEENLPFVLVIQE